MTFFVSLQLVFKFFIAFIVKETVDIMPGIIFTKIVDVNSKEVRFESG